VASSLDETKKRWEAWNQHNFDLPVFPEGQNNCAQKKAGGQGRGGVEQWNFANDRVFILVTLARPDTTAATL
jgi:hypothetical protein